MNMVSVRDGLAEPGSGSTLREGVVHWGLDKTSGSENGVREWKRDTLQR